jgi:hypothetical protein
MVYEAANSLTLGETPDDDIETFDGGYAMEYKKTSKKITAIEDGDGIRAVDYSIAKAKNVYVIDGTGRELEVYAGAAGDYEFDAELINEDGSDFANNLEDGDGSNYADVVIFRTFDGDIVDAVVIKGSTDWAIAD